MKKKNVDRAIVLVMLFLIAVMLFLPNRFENPTYDAYDKVRCKVLEVDDRDVAYAGVVSYGEQVCLVQPLSGERKNQTFEAVNLLSGSLERDVFYEAGDQALVLVYNGENDASKATMIDHYRLHYEMLLVAIFVVLLIAFAGWKGLRAIVAFIFTALAIFKIMIPAILSGLNPILTGALITALTSAVIILMVYGAGMPFIIATLGSWAGTVLTAILALIFIRTLKINGAVIEGAESLFYAGFGHLDLTGVLISSIFLASSGAITDVAVDIVSALEEIIEKKPHIGQWEAIRSGFVIGRNNAATMTTTLLTAYSGGYLGMLMVFVAQGTPLISILNLNSIAAEFLNTIIGSIGLTAVAPLTALIGGTMLRRRHHGQQEQISE